MVFFEGGKGHRGQSAPAGDPRRSRKRDRKIVVHSIEMPYIYIGCNGHGRKYGLDGMPRARGKTR